METTLEKWRRGKGLSHDDVGKRVRRTGRTVRRWEKRECVPDADAMPLLVQLCGPEVLHDFYAIPTPPSAETAI